MNLNNVAKNSRHKIDHCFLLLAALLVILAFFFKSNIALAEKRLTNVNQVTDFFTKEIEGKQQLDSFLEESKKQAEGGIGNKTAILELGKTEGELENKTSELDSINANSLEGKGQEERYKEENNYYNALEVDYSDPKVTNHKKDIDLIVNGSTKLIGRLIEGLSDIGINCKTIKGNKEIEPEYAIEIKKEHYKDTEYNQHICEALRNKYNCTDSITLKCIKTGMRWNEWQDKTVDIPGPVVYTQAKNLGRAIKWKRKRYGWHLIFELQTEWRAYLSQYLNFPLEQIAEEITFPSGNWGGSVGEPPFEIGEEDRLVYPYYRFGYKYREGYKVCEQWQESLDERCNLQ